MKVSNSGGSERKQGTALGFLVLRAVTQVLSYLDMSPCSSKDFVLWKSFKHLAETLQEQGSAGRSIAEALREGG